MIAIRSLIKKQAPAIATVILCAQAAFYYSGSAKETVPTIAPWSQFPTAVEGWKADASLVLEQDVLDALKPDDYLARNYVRPDDSHVINVFVGYFNSRRNGRAPHSPQWCLPGAGWKSVSSKIISIPIPNDTQPLPANEYLIEKGLNKQLVLYWYHQGNRTVANEVATQIYSLPDLFLHGRTDTALVRLIVPVQGDDVNSARAVGIEFAKAVYPLIRTHIT